MHAFLTGFIQRPVVLHVANELRRSLENVLVSRQVILRRDTFGNRRSDFCSKECTHFSSVLFSVHDIDRYLATENTAKSSGLRLRVIEIFNFHKHYN